MYINASRLSDRFTFGIQAFRFVGDYTSVYVHCTVVVCPHNEANSRCSQGCLQASSRRRRASDFDQTSTPQTISNGPYELIAESEGEQLSNLDENAGNLVKPKCSAGTEMSTCISVLSSPCA